LCTPGTWCPPRSPRSTGCRGGWRRASLAPHPATCRSPLTHTNTHTNTHTHTFTRHHHHLLLAPSSPWSSASLPPMAVTGVLTCALWWGLSSSLLLWGGGYNCACVRGFVCRGYARVLALNAGWWACRRSAARLSAPCCLVACWSGCRVCGCCLPTAAGRSPPPWVVSSTALTSGRTCVLVSSRAAGVVVRLFVILCLCVSLYASVTMHLYIAVSLYL
jgi:hypothetical protein